MRSRSTSPGIEDANGSQYISEVSGDDAPGTKIKVIVRVRPLLPREDESLQCLVDMPQDDNTVTKLTVPVDSPYYKKSITKTETELVVKTYSFDQSFWSFNPNDSHYVNNQQFYDRTGKEILEHVFQGYNVCLLAYGQTGSGKTFTMMGDPSCPGIIPQLLNDILRQKTLLIERRINCEVKLSYMEIYNEQTVDLLATSPTKKCRVREHPVTGPYVENLVEHPINAYGDFLKWLKLGNSHRATASTGMNDQSSRSHAIITITLKQTIFKDGDNNQLEPEEEIVSNIKLVDLAGSERLTKTKVYGQVDRMKEGSLINKSLTVLGRCINLLATNSTNPHAKQLVIPYRDSILTYILKENLTGNSKTFMIFCVSPIDFEETYQTLNYASQVKKIKTVAKSNLKKLSNTSIDWEQLQTRDDDVIASLKQEIASLTEQLQENTNSQISNLVQFLETQISQLKFENTYIKQQNQQQQRQIAELNNHINYMDNEYNQQLIHLKSQTQAGAVKYIISRANSNREKLQCLLQEYNPNDIF